MHGLKIDMSFLKYKPIEDKEVTKISGHQGLSIHVQVRYMYWNYEKNHLSGCHELFRNNGTNYVLFKASKTHQSSLNKPW